jgi:hypothetical protein
MNAMTLAQVALLLALIIVTEIRDGRRLDREAMLRHELVEHHAALVLAKYTMQRALPFLDRCLRPKYIHKES